MGYRSVLGPVLGPAQPREMVDPESADFRKETGSLPQGKTEVGGMDQSDACQNTKW